MKNTPYKKKSFLQRISLLFVVFVFTLFALPTHAYISVEACKKLDPPGECKTKTAPGDPGCDLDNERVVDECSGTQYTSVCCQSTAGSKIDDTATCIQNEGYCSNDKDCYPRGFKVGNCSDDSAQPYCCKIQQDPKPIAPKAEFNYVPLEPIPGISPESSSTLKGFLEGLYLFALWSAGIASLFMIGIGGFWYITSAGNTSRVGEAKNIIGNALWGLLVVFIAWLILYVINPDLVRVDLSSLNSLMITGGSVQSGKVYTTNPQGNGTCDPVPVGPCSIENLKNTCFGSSAETMSRLCNKESTGDPQIESGVDVCINYGNTKYPGGLTGTSFSGGLFQINIFAHGSLLGDPRCSNLGSKGTCSGPKKNGICTVGWNCQITNIDNFNYCMQLTKTAEYNIKMACKLSNNGKNLTPWACSANICGLGGVAPGLSDVCKN